MTRKLLQVNHKFREAIYSLPHTTEDYSHVIFTLKGRFAKGNEIVSANGKKLSPTLSSHPKRTVSFARSFHISAWSPG